MKINFSHSLIILQQQQNQNIEMAKTRIIDANKNLGFHFTFIIIKSCFRVQRQHCYDDDFEHVVLLNTIIAEEKMSKMQYSVLKNVRSIIPFESILDLPSCSEQIRRRIPSNRMIHLISFNHQHQASHLLIIKNITCTQKEITFAEIYRTIVPISYSILRLAMGVNMVII